MAVGQILPEGEEQTPQSQGTALPREQTGMEKTLRGIMDKPEFQAFILNAAANLSAGNSLGASMAEGMAGISRFAAAQERMVNDERDRIEREQLRQDRLKTAGRGRGGKGTKGGSGGIGLPNVKRTQLLAQFEREFKRLGEDFDNEMSLRERQGVAWLNTLAQFGRPEMLDAYNSLGDPSLKLQFAEEFANGPERGMQAYNSAVEAGRGTGDQPGTGDVAPTADPSPSPSPGSAVSPTPIPTPAGPRPALGGPNMDILNTQRGAPAAIPADPLTAIPGMGMPQTGLGAILEGLQSPAHPITRRGPNAGF